MKIARRQLRRLINEHMIKPNIPNVPSDDDLGKIDVMARSEDLQTSADVMAHSFDYPEDRSYSDDLSVYDSLSRASSSGDIDKMRDLGHSYADSFSHDDPYDLGGGEGHYFRRHAMKNAAKICDSYESPADLKALIDSFTEGANDYERAQPSSRYRRVKIHEPYNIAGWIYLHSGKLALYGKNYSDLYDTEK